MSSAMAQEHLLFTRRVKNFCKFNIPLRAKFYSSYFSRTNTNFKSFNGTNDTCIRCCCITPFPRGFEEREKIMNFTNVYRELGYMLLYIRPGGYFARLEA